MLNHFKERIPWRLYTHKHDGSSGQAVWRSAIWSTHHFRHHLPQPPSVRSLCAQASFPPCQPQGPINRQTHSKLHPSKRLRQTTTPRIGLTRPYWMQASCRTAHYMGLMRSASPRLQNVTSSTALTMDFLGYDSENMSASCCMNDWLPNKKQTKRRLFGNV